MSETLRDIGVFYQQFRVGSLRVGGRQGRISLRYDPRWLATGGAFPLSRTMPLGEDDYEPDLVEPWLDNLLPEEGNRRFAAVALGLARGDVAGMLDAMGGDTAGAFSFGRPSDPAAWRWAPLAEWYARRRGGERMEEGTALAAHFEDLARRPFMAGEDGEVRISLAGGQRKSAIAVLDPEGRPKLGLPGPGDRLAVPVAGAPSTVILKPDNEHLPGVVENEAFCLELARLCGLPTINWSIVSTGGRLGILLARYDRLATPDGRIRRRHQEDFCQALGLPPRLKYERSGQHSGPTLADLFGVARELGPEASLRLLDYVIINVLMANTDAHAKNYSILIGSNVELAPLYDVVCAAPWRDVPVTQNLAQNIAGRARRPWDVTPAHWDAVAASGGFGARETARRVRELIDLIVRQRGEAERRVNAHEGVTPPITRDVADAVEQCALRIGGRFR